MSSHDERSKLAWVHAAWTGWTASASTAMRIRMTRRVADRRPDAQLQATRVRVGVFRNGQLPNALSARTVALRPTETTRPMYAPR